MQTLRHCRYLASPAPYGRRFQQNVCAISSSLRHRRISEHWLCSNQKSRAMVAIVADAEAHDANFEGSLLNTTSIIPGGHLMKLQYRITLLMAAVLAFATVHADNQTGHITRVSYATTGVLIMLDTGPPASCSATPFGWMMIAAPYTAM